MEGIWFLKWQCIAAFRKGEKYYMSENYTPPFTMTEEIMNMVIEIGELVGQIDAHNNLSANLTLRRENRIKTIYSSLAIEQNTLTLEQVTDVIDGKRVLAPPADIREVKNAYEAYERLQKLDMYSVKDLLKAHKIMTEGLVKEAGVFRSKNAGVYDQNHVLIHAGSPANYVPSLVQELFLWLKQSNMHPLVKSCIFHYEFEFIHPFADGNGRTGRLWHTLILQNWKEFFAWLPIETMIHENQNDYYATINASNKAGESTVFVAFMLHMIRRMLKEIVDNQNAHKNVGRNVGRNVEEMSAEEKILLLLKDNPKMTAKQLAATLDLSRRQVERGIAALKAAGKLERVGATKNGSWKVVE